ncbi:uncharacterized protein LOC135848596 [Planococcus citri]|uniref:uncharacterized protein LOC135848596 n=1 Tax=Planococcus citri TaxID=170843 RepID=UPI0031F8786B
MDHFGHPHSEHHHDEHDHHGHDDHNDFDHHDHHNMTASAAVNVMFEMNPLLQAKLITMFVLCFVSFLLGIIPLKLVRLMNMKVPSCKTHSHGGDSEQPLLMSLLLCFGGGVLLFTTFLHLQPEVRESMEPFMHNGQLPDFVTKNHLHFADLVFCAGFFLVYVIEEVVHAILDLGSHHHEDEAVLHRTMSLRKCAKHSMDFHRRHHKGTMIPRVSLANNPIKTDIPDSSLLSVSTTSRQGLLEHGSNTLMKRPNQHLTVDTLPQISAAASSTDAETESSAGSTHEITTKKSFRGLFAILALSFHEVFEGLAVGLEKDVQNVWYLFAAIATHKFVLSFCLGVELISTRTKIPLVILYICTFAVVTPIGISSGILLLLNRDPSVPGGTLVTVILQGIASGTLLYVTFFEILQKEKANAKSGILQLLAIMAGFGFMLALQFLTGHEHTHNHSHLHSHEHHH